MLAEYYVGNRTRLYEKLTAGSLVAVFSGENTWKTDVGIYHEEWGIGFRLEDNCLVTEDGCENLSAGIPRTIEDIEAAMRGE